MKPLTSRRVFVESAAAASTFASIGIVRAPARAAEFQYKYANNLSIDSPLTVRATQMWNAVKHETNGRLEVQVFPGAVLGGDTSMFSQLRSGAIQFFTVSGIILASIVPAAAVEGMPLAFPSEAIAYKALDGSLGAYIRQAMLEQNLYLMPRIWSQGFSQITASPHPIRTIDDMKNFKIRVAASKMLVDAFASLGASPVTMNFSEAYTALQSHIVDGQETPTSIILLNKIYEVQKYLSITNHKWAGFWMAANGDAWKNLPPDIRAVVERNEMKYAALQRRDVTLLNESARDKLQRLGLQVNVADTKEFRPKLTGFYGRMKTDFGDKAWTLLESYVGKLT